MKRTLPVSMYFFFSSGKVVSWKWAQCGQVIEAYSTMVTGAVADPSASSPSGARHHELGHGDIGTAGRFGTLVGAAPLVIGAWRQRSDRGDRRDRAADQHCRRPVSGTAAASLTRIHA